MQLCPFSAQVAVADPKHEHAKGHNITSYIYIYLSSGLSEYGMIDSLRAETFNKLTTRNFFHLNSPFDG